MVYLMRCEHVSMCDLSLVVCTCSVYGLSACYVMLQYNNIVSVFLFVLLAVCLGLQMASDCDMAYVKIGAALLALMLFCVCRSCGDYISRE